MGGFDFCCAVSGARYFDGRDDVLDDITHRILYHIRNDRSPYETCKPEEDLVFSDTTRIPSEVLKGLLYTQEDVDASNDFVMFCPTSISEGEDDFSNMDYESLRDEDNITEVFNVVTQDPDIGIYASRNGENWYTVAPRGAACIVMYSAYLILRQAAPTINPRMLFKLCMRDEFPQGAIPGIDYAPLNSDFLEQYVQWAFICDLPRGDYFSESPAFWHDILIQPGKSTEEILRMAWGRPGNLWALVRPDRFPIPETLTRPNLPTFFVDGDIAVSTPALTLNTDLLLLICEYLPARSIFTMMSVCKHFRAHLLPNANPIMYRRIRDEEPWLLPAGPFKLSDPSRGREEVDWWTAEWAKCGLTGDLQELTTRIPWTLYRMACSESYSMWNRKRIWGIAKQIEEMAEGESSSEEGSEDTDLEEE